MTEPNQQLVEADNATPDQMARANAAVEANLIDGVPKYDSAQGYACALAAIQATDGECQRLRSALEELEGKARLGGDCLGNSPPNFKPCQDSFYLLADIAAAALKEQSA